MKANHDLDTAVTEGSLVIKERYSIPIEYGLHVLQPGQRPYSSDAPGMCISMDALEAGLRFPLHSLIEECLRWWRISPSQVAPNSWRYLVVFLGECRGVRIILTQDLFMAFWGFRLDWSAHPIGNASLYLSEEESVLVDRLKGILSSSRAIKEIRWISVSCVGCPRFPATRLLRLALLPGRSDPLPQGKPQRLHQRGQLTYRPSRPSMRLSDTRRSKC
ncbi:hypothetical protein BHM03_00005797 [Ensete ventricosum]|nr:hypothetical protein BHM03_00005797 [Ensete ventricosum]